MRKLRVTLVKSDAGWTLDERGPLGFVATKGPGADKVNGDKNARFAKESSQGAWLDNAITRAIG